MSLSVATFTHQKLYSSQLLFYSYFSFLSITGACDCEVLIFIHFMVFLEPTQNNIGLPVKSQNIRWSVVDHEQTVLSVICTSIPIVLFFNMMQIAMQHLENVA